jgi:mRNA interferase MazF
VGISQYEIYWISLDPTVGGKMKKTRPCVILSPDEINHYLKTILVAPLTSSIRNIPFRIKMFVRGKPNMIALDQMRAIDKSRFQNKLGEADKETIRKIKQTIHEMLVK